MAATRVPVRIPTRCLARPPEEVGEPEAAGEDAEALAEPELREADELEPAGAFWEGYAEPFALISKDWEVAYMSVAKHWNRGTVMTVSKMTREREPVEGCGENTHWMS